MVMPFHTEDIDTSDGNFDPSNAQHRPWTKQLSLLYKVEGTFGWNDKVQEMKMVWIRDWQESSMTLESRNSFLGSSNTLKSHDDYGEK